MSKRVLISGCSGGGKSTLLAALSARGYTTMPEPGLRIVREERAGSGAALPWVDMAAFARRALALAQADLAAVAEQDGVVFFDRGLVDAAVALHHAAGVALYDSLGLEKAYAETVFLAPPWSEIFIQDADRPHGFEEAVAEYERLTRAFQDLGYGLCVLPKQPVEARAAFIIGQIEAAGMASEK